MPEIILNVSGTTRTTGTANPVISGTTGKSGPFTDLADGTEVAYVRRYSSNRAGFENCIGIWRSATDTIERTSVEKSSNSGSAVVWGVGEQTIDATVTPDMIVADTDPRLVSEDVDDMTPATELDGTEKIAASQGGDPVNVTTQLLSPSAIIQAQKYNRKTVQSFTPLTHTPPLFSATDQSMFGVEPVVCHLGNGGTVTQPAILSWPLNRGLALCSMSTNTASYAGITSSNQPFYPDPSLADFYFGAVVGLTALPAAGGQRFIIGITPAPGNLAPTKGMYFSCTNANANWVTITAGASVRTVNSGVAVTTVNAFSLPTAWTTFEIMANADDEAVGFYINGNLVVESDKAFFYPPSGLYFAGAYCFQGGSSTANSMLVDAMHNSIATYGGDAGYGLSTGLL